jgi:hypothetical protein
MDGLGRTDRAYLLTPASQVLPLEIVERRIYLIRGHKVMLSTHLAELYEAEPRLCRH